jgi:ketosteroid isomerase-like protein
MTEGWLDMANAWEELRTVVDEYRQLDDERVLVLLRRSGRGKTSGLELGGIGSEGAAMFHVRDGKVTRLVVYFDRRRALAGLDLAPDSLDTG